MKRIFVTFIAALCFAACLAPQARAQDGKVDSEMFGLRERFEQRYARIHALKSKGVIGETAAGYVEFVSNTDDSAAGTVNDENADRKSLYELIAKKENTTAAKVAERNAKRNFEKAKPGEYLKGPDGKWQKKGEEQKQP
jgi:uncharacterized protein YdbL (DUF1318 family)